MPRSTRPRTFALSRFRKAVRRRRRALTGRLNGQSRGPHKRPFGSVEDGTLHMRWDGGFFSVCSVTLLELVRAPEPVRRIDASDALERYRQHTVGSMWGRFFAEPQAPLPNPRPGSQPWGCTLVHHDRYASLDLAPVRPFLDSYFRPSVEVEQAVARLTADYAIDPERTVAVWVRGTDKGREIRPRSTATYRRAVARALASGRVDRVLVQSDQQQVRDELLACFGSAAFAFEELPVTSGVEGLHSLDLDGREEHARDLLAAVLIMARCADVVLHTGNGALWTVLFRGGTDGVVQVR